MILFETTTPGGDKVSVRRAGQSVRLYRNGVFHTQYHPQKPIRDTVWDILALPALLARKGKPRRALLLGVGGGAVIHIWRTLFPEMAITGVEICPENIELSRKYFGLDDLHQVTLHWADAQQWVSHYKGPKFDVVVEDCFDPSSSEVERALTLDERWCRSLAKVTAADGVVVVNTGSVEELRTVALRNDKKLREKFSGRWSLQVPGTLNRVGVFHRGGEPNSRLADVIASLHSEGHQAALEAVPFTQRRIS